MNQYWVYILACSDDSYYTGITSNVDARFAQHSLGVDPGCYTYTRRPLQLLHAELFNDPEEAIFCEKRLKGWSRAKKEALTRGDWGTIRRLARTHGERCTLTTTLRQAQGDIEVAREGDIEVARGG